MSRTLLLFQLLVTTFTGINNIGKTFQLFSKKKEFDTVKILSVRDEDGKVIAGAKTVEVWKTAENKFKSYNVLGETGGSYLIRIKF